MKEIQQKPEKPIAPANEVVRFIGLVAFIADPAHSEFHGNTSWSRKIDSFGAEIGQDIIGNVNGINIYKKVFTETIERGGNRYTISYVSDNFLQRTIGHPFIDVQFGQCVPESVQNDFLLNKTAGPTTLENGVVINPANEELAKEVNDKLKKIQKHLKR